jgi:hypothetical protein
MTPQRATGSVADVQDADLIVRANVVEDAVRVARHRDHPHGPSLRPVTGGWMFGQEKASRTNPRQQLGRGTRAVMGDMGANVVDLLQRPCGEEDVRR